MKVPFVDLYRQYQLIQKDIDGAINKVICDSAFVLGKYVEEFEGAFANYCGTKYCVGVSSGTDALLLSFIAIGLKSGDEVITAPNTFFASTEPLGHIGVKPVFVDIEQKTHLIDINKIERAITPKTKAILPVHLYGQMANMEVIMSIARKYNLKVIEDCAQAHGAEQRGRKAGTFGDIGAYSFYPAKNLGAYGDSGCVVTSNEEYFNTVKMLRDHGRRDKYEHNMEGYNSRMDGIQGAILNTKLKYLNGWVERRREIAELYGKLLSDEISKPLEVSLNKHAYHLYVIEVDRRDELLKYLREQNIGAGIHYPIPLHLQRAYQHLGLSEGLYPECEKSCRRVISLPIFPEMKQEEIEFVANSVNSFVDGR